MILTYHIPLPKTQTHTKRKTIPCEYFPSAHICQLPTYNVMEEDLDICCNAVCWSTVKILGPRNHPGSKMGKWVLRGKDVLTLSVPERCEGGLVFWWGRPWRRLWSRDKHTECRGVPERDASPSLLRRAGCRLVWPRTLSVCECVHEWVNVRQYWKALWVATGKKSSV